MLKRDKRRRDAGNFRGGNGYDKNNCSLERERERERHLRKEKRMERGKRGSW